MYKKTLLCVHVSALCSVYQSQVHMAVANCRFTVIFLHRNKLKSGIFTVQLGWQERSHVKTTEGVSLWLVHQKLPEEILNRKKKVREV